MAQNPAIYVKIGLMNTEKDNRRVRPAQTGQNITEVVVTLVNYVMTQKQYTEPVAFAQSVKILKKFVLKFRATAPTQAAFQGFRATPEANMGISIGLGVSVTGGVHQSNMIMTLRLANCTTMKPLRSQAPMAVTSDVAILCVA